MALVVANETYLADLILPFVDVFQMGRVEMMSRAGRGACEIIALRLREPRPGRAGCGPTVVRDDEPQSHAYLCLCLLSRREAVRAGGALAAGPLHSVVAGRGRVWSFGHGAHGRLGLGGSWLSACTPRPVELPSRAPTLLWRLADDAVIVKVAACGAHSLALDAEGRVFSWGDGDGGRLGHGDDAGKLFWFGAENGLSYVTDFLEAETDGLLCWRLPTGVPARCPTRAAAARARRRRRPTGRRSGPWTPSTTTATRAAATATATPRRWRRCPAALRPAAASADAVVIVDGAAHQLCRDGTGAFSRRRLALPAPAVAAACSDEHYLVLTDDGDVHSAGNGGHGRLGHGSHTSNQDPKRIDALNRDG
ncbi:guanyl-nucleotide exchange factor [Aureococcus anophagefferens]|uniref:Guanyl-nucleotide exchange factor n=1 Tax=Aureococcus anophagefferens TaxID=44056 RepID=A0ABR1G701_AURAN